MTEILVKDSGRLIDYHCLLMLDSYQYNRQDVVD